MVRQNNDQQWGWYDEIMRGQYYDELIPAYEALQEQMVASSRSLFMICARGLFFLVTTLPALVRRAGPLPAAHLTPTQGLSRTRDATEQLRLEQQLR
jgi:hypothetical protein